MATSLGNGRSTLPDTTAAVKAAVAEALEALGGRKPAFGLLFSGPDHPIKEVLAAAQGLVGEAPLMASSTAGEFTQTGLSHGGVAAVLVAADDIAVHPTFATGLKQEPMEAAERLARGFEETAAVARNRGWSRSATLLLVDGLAGTGQRVADGVLKRTRIAQQIVGGAAGDEGRFQSTSVGAGAQSGPDSAAALHVFGPQRWGVGVNHGLRATTEKMTVTRAEGNALIELDGRPAFEAYQRHAQKKGITLQAETAGSYLIENEIGLYLFGQLSEARAPLSVRPDGALICAADVPQGRQVCILDGDPPAMIAAARQAAEEAREGLGSHEPAGAIVFDCICRGLILKDRFQEEIDAVRGVLGNVPVTGFLTYGEIAHCDSKLSGWHNTTAVVVAIPK